MDLKQIRYFLEVVDQGSINMAAHKLGMTQPPVSKQMQLLEQELGCELFRRNSRPLELTPEGKVLYERGSALLAMAQGMVQAVADCPEHPGRNPAPGPGKQRQRAGGSAVDRPLRPDAPRCGFCSV